MFERYTEPSRRVIFMARYAASQTGSRIIETEHLLLGLLREDKGLAQRFLGSPSGTEDVWKRIQQTKPDGKSLGPGDLPLSNESKRVLTFARDEADRQSSQPIRTEHLLLGLLLEKKCLAAEILRERGLSAKSVRQELTHTPHKFVRIPDPQQDTPGEPRNVPTEIAEAQNRLREIVKRMEQAVANHDFVTARACSDEERKERITLRELYEKHGLDGWLFQ